MKTFKLITIALFFVAMSSLESCGPVVISSRPSQPMPPWFYPNRVENVRYMYFPEFSIYYDLTLRNYIYFDNGAWLHVNVLPPRYNTVNFRRARQVRINNYFGDNIREYHSKNMYTRERQETRSKGRRH
jgi:hypothetical protein